MLILLSGLFSLSSVQAELSYQTGSTVGYKQNVLKSKSNNFDSGYLGVNASMNHGSSSERTETQINLGLNASEYADERMSSTLNYNLKGSHNVQLETGYNTSNVEIIKTPETDTSSLNPVESAADSSITTTRISNTHQHQHDEKLSSTFRLSLAQKAFSNATLNDIDSMNLRASLQDKKETWTHIYAINYKTSDNQIVDSTTWSLEYKISNSPTPYSDWSLSIGADDTAQNAKADTASFTAGAAYNQALSARSTLSVSLDSSNASDDDGVTRQRNNLQLSMNLNQDASISHLFSVSALDSGDSSTVSTQYGYSNSLGPRSSLGFNLDLGSRNYSLGKTDFSGVSTTFNYRF